MKITRVSLGALAYGAACAAHAEFSWELAGTAGETERAQAFELDRRSLSAAYYFDPVADESGPYELAAFLDPATRVSVSVSEDDQASRVIFPPTGTVVDLQSDTNDYTVAGEYVLPRSKWFAGGRYSEADIELPPSDSSVIETDAHRLGLIAGRYLGAGATRLQLSMERAKTEVEQSIRICFAACVTGSAGSESTSDEVRLDATHVRRFRSATYALVGGISETDAHLMLRTPSLSLPGAPATPGSTVERDVPDVRAYSVGATLYPVRRLGVGLAYTRLDSAAAEQDAVELGASWFFGRSIGLKLALSRNDPEGDGPTTDAAVLRLIGRL